MTISNFELVELFKKNNIDMTIDDVIMSDELKNRGLKEGACIINLDDPNGPGSHWVCLIVVDDLAFYFDSYGALFDRYVLDYCQKFKLRLAYNRYIIQDLASVECGVFCFKLILFTLTEKINEDCTREFPQSKFLELCNDYINLFVPDTSKNDGILKGI